MRAIEKQSLSGGKRSRASFTRGSAVKLDADAMTSSWLAGYMGDKLSEAHARHEKMVNDAVKQAGKAANKLLNEARLQADRGLDSITSVRDYDCSIVDMRLFHCVRVVAWCRAARMTLESWLP